MDEGPGPGTSDDKRRVPRYSVSLPVRIRLKRSTVEMLTSEVSRHGVFVRSDDPIPVRHLVQLTLTLPDSKIVEVMGMVARIVRPGEDEPSGPGMGIDFFAMSAAAKTHWAEFIYRLRQEALELEQRIEAEESSESGPEPQLPEATGTGLAGTGLLVNPDDADIPGLAEIFEEIPEAVIIPDGRDEEVPPALIVGDGDEPIPPEPVRRRAPRYTAAFLVRLKDQNLLKTFYTTDISTGGMFLKTPLLKRAGDVVELYLVHPETDQEFKLSGTVKRVVSEAAVTEQGLGIELDPLDDDLRWTLINFIETGVGAFEPSEAPEKQMLEILRSAIELAPDHPRAHAALAERLLEDHEDAEGAIEAYENALDLDPDFLPAHRGLRIAYGMLGDAERVQHHLREVKRIRQERPDEDEDSEL